MDLAKVNPPVVIDYKKSARLLGHANTLDRLGFQMIFERCDQLMPLWKPRRQIRQLINQLGYSGRVGGTVERNGNASVTGG